MARDACPPRTRQERCCWMRADAQYFQFKETPQSVAAKGFQRLEALTPGGEPMRATSR
jgi:hypothetical protein